MTGDDSWLRAALRSLPDPPVPTEVDEAIHQVIARECDARDHDTPARRRVGRWWGVAAAAVVVVGTGLAAWTLASTPSVGDDVVALGSGTSVRPVSTGTNYTAANVAATVPANLTTARAAASVDVRRPTFAATADGIRSCLEGVGGPPERLRLLDLATYDDVPVAVMAFLDSDHDSTADVVVVGIRCSRQDPQVRMRQETTMTWDVPPGAARP